MSQIDYLNDAERRILSDKERETRRAWEAVEQTDGGIAFRAYLAAREEVEIYDWLTIHDMRKEPLPITAEQADAATRLIEEHAPAATTTTDVPPPAQEDGK